MKAVAMECRFRICASPERLRVFLERASAVVASAFSAPVKYSRLLEESDSLMLQRQWRRGNGPDQSFQPEVWEVSFAFFDTSGRLTVARLESMSRDVLAELEVDRPGAEGEVVPWILTLVADIDEGDIARRHPDLGVGSSAGLSSAT